MSWALGACCSYCQARLLKCSHYPRRPSALHFVLAKVSSPSPSKPVVVDSLNYTTACFERGFGTLHLVSVMLDDGMVALSQTSPDVSEAISLLGEMSMYLCGGGGISKLMKQRKGLERVTARRQAVCYHQYRKRTTWAIAPLACWLIMLLIDVRTYTRADTAQHRRA